MDIRLGGCSHNFPIKRYYSHKISPKPQCRELLTMKYVFEVQTGFIWKEKTDGSTKVQDFTIIAKTAIEACEKTLKLIGSVSEETKEHGIISVERKDKIDA